MVLSVSFLCGDFACEVLAIAVGLSTFAGMLHGRKVVASAASSACSESNSFVHKASARKGSAQAWDHNVMIHDIWSLVRCSCSNLGACTAGHVARQC